MKRTALQSLPALAFLLAACGLSGCAASLGPGYTVVAQQVRVTFQSQSPPRVLIEAEYRLKNVGNQDLNFLDVRLPGKRFRAESTAISWDGSALSPSISADNPRDAVLRFPDRWSIGAAHVLRFSYELSPPPGSDDSVGISPDAFYLAAEAWSPQLPQPPGVFGFGGVPPKYWNLLVSVPQDFLVHASGQNPKRSRKGNADDWVFRQSAGDLAPFVVAGRYRELRQDLSQGRRVYIWTRAQLDPAKIQREGESFARALAAYDSLFSAPGKSRAALWIVECPVDYGCRSSRESGYSKLLFGDEPEASSELISQDTAVVLSLASSRNPETVAVPALAAGWLGYGRNPGFYEHQLPMSALPAFAAAQAREAIAGPNVRDEIIRRALQQVPAGATRESNNDPEIFRAKSLLLFYALRDRVGTDVFQNAMQHMLAARRSRGFDVSDLISAVEQEAHRPVGPFVREWIKGSGVPAEFRAKYFLTSASKTLRSEEATP